MCDTLEGNNGCDGGGDEGLKVEVRTTNGSGECSTIMGSIIKASLDFYKVLIK